MSLRQMAIGGMLALASAAHALVPRQNMSLGAVSGEAFILDPTVLKTPRGNYLAAYPRDHVHLKTSADRTRWQNAGAEFPGGAPWTTAYTKGGSNLCAHDISYRNGQYYLYYSASTFGSS